MNESFCIIIFISSITLYCYNILSMELSELITIYNKNKNKIDKNVQKYYMYIKSNPYLYEKYKNVIREKRKEITEFKRTTNVQHGGLSNTALIGIGASTIGASLSSAILLIVVGAGLYFFYNREKCAVEYPLISHDTPITITSLLYLFIPPSLIPEDDEIGESDEKNIGIMDKNLNKTLETFMGVMDIADNNLPRIINAIDKLNAIIRYVDPETATGKKAMKLLQTALGAISTVAAAGLPADTIVNLIFTIKDAIALIIRILHLFEEVIKTLTSLCESERQLLLFYLYDIMNINFKTGPFGVKCQYEYIKKKYPEREKLDLLLCKLFSTIYLKFVGFFSNAIGASIPYNFGKVAHMISSLLESNTVKKLGFSVVINKASGYYNQIPTDFKKIIQDPDGIGNMIRCLFDPYTAKMIYDRLDGEIDNIIRKNAKKYAGVVGSVGALAFSAAKGITGKISTMVVGDTPVRLISSNFFKMLGYSMEELQNTKKPSYCENVYADKSKKKKLEDSEGTEENFGNDMQNEQTNSLSKTFIKYGGFIGFLIHKLLAFSFLLLYIFKDCPIGDKLNKKYNEVMSAECPVENTQFSNETTETNVNSEQIQEPIEENEINEELQKLQ